MKTPYDFLVRLLPKATPADEVEAKNLGVDVDTYRATKLQVLAEQAQKPSAGAEPPPLDITAEAMEARRLRSQRGIFKPRHAAPNLLVQAAKTPGEVAQMILFVICYFIGMVLLLVVGGERVTKMEGIFQCLLLGVLIIPAMWVSGRIWAAIGERARDVLRLMVRFWPLTLFALFFLLVILGALRRQLLPGAP